jgi:hypothetical protein
MPTSTTESIMAASLNGLQTNPAQELNGAAAGCSFSARIAIPDIRDKTRQWYDNERSANAVAKRNRFDHFGLVIEL